MNKWMTSTCNLFQIAAVKRCEVASLLPKMTKRERSEAALHALAFLVRNTHSSQVASPKYPCILS